MTCICEFDDGCNGLGYARCTGCGGDLCVCDCGGEIECGGCDACVGADECFEDEEPCHVG